MLNQYRKVLPKPFDYICHPPALFGSGTCHGFVKQSSFGFVASANTVRALVSPCERSPTRRSLLGSKPTILKLNQLLFKNWICKRGLKKRKLWPRRASFDDDCIFEDCEVQQYIAYLKRTTNSGTNSFRYCKVCYLVAIEKDGSSIRFLKNHKLARIKVVLPRAIWTN